MEHKLKNQSPYHLYKDSNDFVEVIADSLSDAVLQCDFKPVKIIHILHSSGGIIPKDMLVKRQKEELAQNEQDNQEQEITNTEEEQSEPPAATNE
jgi:hypothetical protein